MSDVEETKAGHPPAVKVGNMRVPGNRSRNSSNSEKAQQPAGDSAPSAEELKKQEAEFNSGGQVAEQPKQGQIISGAVVSEAKAFTPAAVKAYHEKPQPTHEKSHAPSTHNIHQPKK